jgi:hypothetical protein
MSERNPSRYQSSRGDYRIILIAIPFIVGGILLLLKTSPVPVIGGAFSIPGQVKEGTDIEIMSPPMSHLAGTIGILIGIFIVGFYGYLRRQIGKKSRSAGGRYEANREIRDPGALPRRAD